MCASIAQTFAGYTCSTCSRWVNAGEFHCCSTTTTPTVTYAVPCCACYAQIQQLLDKLDKLIEILSKGKEDK